MNITSDNEEDTYASNVYITFCGKAFNSLGKKANIDKKANIIDIKETFILYEWV